MTALPSCEQSAPKRRRDDSEATTAILEAKEGHADYFRCIDNLTPEQNEHTTP